MENVRGWLGNEVRHGATDELLVRNSIVRVELRDDVALRLSQSEVQREGLSEVAASKFEHSQSRISEAFHHLNGGVRAVVGDDNDFEVWVVLGEEITNKILYNRLLVVRGDQNRHRRRPDFNRVGVESLRREAKRDKSEDEPKDCEGEDNRTEEDRNRGQVQ